MIDRPMGWSTIGLSDRAYDVNVSSLLRLRKGMADRVFANWPMAFRLGCCLRWSARPVRAVCRAQHPILGSPCAYGSVECFRGHVRVERVGLINRFPPHRHSARNDTDFIAQFFGDPLRFGHAHLDLCFSHCCPSGRNGWLPAEQKSRPRIWILCKAKVLINSVVPGPSKSSVRGGPISVMRL